jgi:hypothetical protein
MPLVVMGRLQHTWRGYLDSVVRQAANRDWKRIIHPEEYLAERFNNIGAWLLVSNARDSISLMIV